MTGMIAESTDTIRNCANNTTD